jgi:uncharacterized protein
MSTPQSSSRFIEEISEKTVVDYLQRHPDFLTLHGDLLTKLEVPTSYTSRTTVVPLAERQLGVLREENRQLQRQLADLIAIATKNEELNQRIQGIIATLASANSPDEFFDTLYSQLQQEFDTDAIVVRLFLVPPPFLMGRPEFVEYDAQMFALFERVLEKQETLCGRLTTAQADYLVPHGNIVSAVLMPIGSPKPHGLLAIGSQEVSRFHAGMSTDLLRYMGELVSHLLNLWLRH